MRKVDCMNSMWFWTRMGELSGFCTIHCKFWEFHLPSCELENGLRISCYLLKWWAFWLLGGCTWIFNCWFVHEWSFIIWNTKIQLLAKLQWGPMEKIACILLPVLEAVCTWLTSWIAFGGSTGAGLHSSGSCAFVGFCCFVFNWSWLLGVLQPD